MVKKICLTKLNHRQSMSNDWLLFQGLNVYIPNHKYQVKPHSSPCLSAACGKVHRNHFHCLYLKSKVKLKRLSDCWKRVPEAAKLVYANKKIHSIASILFTENIKSSLALNIFGKLLIVFSTKINLSHFHYSITQSCCLIYLVNQNYLLKNFLRTLILMTQIPLYLFFLLEPKPQW